MTPPKTLLKTATLLLFVLLVSTFVLYRAGMLNRFFASKANATAGQEPIGSIAPSAMADTITTPNNMPAKDTNTYIWVDELVTQYNGPIVSVDSPEKQAEVVADTVAPEAAPISDSVVVSHLFDSMDKKELTLMLSSKSGVVFKPTFKYLAPAFKFKKKRVLKYGKKIQVTEYKIGPVEQAPAKPVTVISSSKYMPLVSPDTSFFHFKSHF